MELPSPRLRVIWIPEMRCSASATVVSGRRPMSVAVIESTICSEVRLIACADASDCRRPVTTMSVPSAPVLTSPPSSAPASAPAVTG